MTQLLSKVKYDVFACHMLRHVILNEPRDGGNTSRNWFTIWSKLDSGDLKKFFSKIDLKCWN